MLKQRFALMLLVQLAFVCVSGLHAQVQTLVPAVVSGAKPAKVEQITVHGTSLEGNLEGDAVNRPVIVYLPPSYPTDMKRRYPVVYAFAWLPYRSYSALNVPAQPLGADVTVTSFPSKFPVLVVQLYLQVPAVKGAPLMALRGFERINLKPAQARRSIST